MKSSPMINGQLSLSQTTKLCVKEHFLPILKCTLTSPATPIWSPLAVLTETELGVICDVKPSVAMVSIFMQLISAPESNKHENTYPPVSILNVVPLDLPVSIV